MKDSFTLNDIILLSQSENEIMPMHSHEENEWNSEMPNETIVSNLINYSKALTVLKTKKLGTINLLMN